MQKIPIRSREELVEVIRTTINQDGFFADLNHLDVSLIVSPYGYTAETAASGERTIVALTGLRVSLILVLVVIGYAYWLIQPHALAEWKSKPAF